jgi:biotin transporter BioY
MAKKMSKAEIKRTTAAAIGAAFGFIIALIWRDIIVGLFNLAGLKVNEIAEAMDAVIAIISGIIITVICVLGIIYISRWGGVEE